MTEKRPTPDTAAGRSRRKRTAPTIDLKATEVESAPVASGAPPQETHPQPHVHDSPAHEPSMQESSEPSHPAPESPEPKSASAPPPQSPPDAPRNGSGFRPSGPMLAAGVAGAAAMSLVLLGLWLTGLLPIRFAGSTATRARVTALEMQLQDLQKRPAPVVDTQAVDALHQRVARMEESIKNIPASASGADPALAERVSAAENAMKSLGLALTALNRRGDELTANTAQARERAEAAEKAVTDLRAGLQDVSKTAKAGASSAELAPLQQRIAALEQSLKAARADIAKATVSDNAARLALSAAALRDAVWRGTPFTNELAQAKSLGADEKVLAPLAFFAAGGLPSEKALARELGALLPGMQKASGTQVPSGGFFERLQANAGQLVRVRPLDAPPGDETAAVLARIEIAAAHEDIAAALADLDKLSDARRAPAQGWIAKAKNRQAALTAARQFAADMARALGSR